MELPFPFPEPSRTVLEDISEDFLKKLGTNALGMFFLADRSYYKKFLIYFLAR